MERFKQEIVKPEIAAPRITEARDDNTKILPFYFMEKIIILGIKISNLNREQIIEETKKFLNSRKQNIIVTPNAEIILKATESDEELFYILNNADLALADTISLKLASWLRGGNLPRYAGADYVKDTLALAEKEGIKIAVLNWQDGLSKKQDIESALNNLYPKLNFVVSDLSRQGAYNFNQINKFEPKIIYVTLGSPWQEKFVYHNIKNIPSAKIGIGVGGSFDYLTGKIQRAPKIMRLIGLEWLWRLIIQPKRWQRIYRAVFVFTYRLILWRFILPHFYRPNIACLLYKKHDGQYSILIAERANEPGHWQLPQGGLDGENFMEAGARELKEEINSDKFKPITFYKNLHQYEFGENLSKFGIPAAKSRGYKGQKQGLFIAEFLGEDIDIKVNFWEFSNWKWVRLEDFLETTFPSRRKGYELYLEKFKEVNSKQTTENR